MAKGEGRLKVRLYMSAHTLDGYIRMLPEQRLLDILNGVLRGKLRAEGEFLQVSEAELSSLNGRKVALQSAYINRANILFAREIGDETRRPSKLYPFISKSARDTKLYMPLYILTGQMHLAKREGVQNVLNSGMRFFPLTNVEIVSPGSSESVSFVAVNKAYIISLEEKLVKNSKGV